MRVILLPCRPAGRVSLALLFTAGLAAPVSAHVLEPLARDAFWSAWTAEPLVLLPLVVTSWVYGRGVHRVWAHAGRGRGVSYGSVLSFAGGQAALFIALVSPLDALGGTLLSAHMAQHGLLGGVAPPLLVMSRPGAAFAWGLNGVWSTWRSSAILWRRLGRAAHALSFPIRATALHGVTLWLWHAPALFALALAHDGVHALQHVSFFIPAVIFWNALLGARSPGRSAAAAAAAFITFMHTGLLGALIAMAPAPIYTTYVGRTGGWGLTALDDQQLAGLFMWIPLGLPYIAAGLFLASQLVRGHLDDGGACDRTAGTASDAQRQALAASIER
jgi:putative membrane protein